MVNIYEYLDYQQYLKDYVEHQRKKKSWFSYRHFASQLKMDHSNFLKLLSGNRHASKSILENIKQAIGLNPREADFFQTLVAFKRTKDHIEMKKLIEKLILIKGLNLNKLNQAQYEYYQKWYYTAIFTLLDCYTFTGDFKDLAKQLTPTITPKQAKESILLLDKLDLIKKDANGHYRPSQPMITSGESWRDIAIRGFQEETLNLAINSLNYQSENVRDISTLTISVTKKDVVYIKELIQDFKKSVIKLIRDNENSDSVYQINMQLFPMTKPKWTWK